MNDAPHLLAIVESKLAQVRTHLQHNSLEKASDLMAQVKIYTDEVNASLTKH